MFGDQTPLNIVLATKHFTSGHLVWCCLVVFDKIWKPSSIRSNNLKHFFCSRVWWAMYMFDQTQMKQLIQAAEQALYACAHQTCLIHDCPNEQNIAHQTREQKKCFTFLIECLMTLTRPNTIKHDQTRSNTIKQHQTRCPNGKMFGHQTMYDGVWSPNIYRLSWP